MAEDISIQLQVVESDLLKKSHPIGCKLERDFEAIYKTRSNFLLQSESGLELGGPDLGSAFAVVRGNSALGNDDLKLYGTEIAEGSGRALGLFVKVSGTKLTDELFYMISQNVRKYLQIRGVMVKGADDEIWLRISHDAIREGLSFAKIGSIVAARIHAGFPEAEAVRIIFVSGESDSLEYFGAVAKACVRAHKALKAAVWKARGYDFQDCGLLGHCGECSDKKICANVKKMDRDIQSNRIEIRREESVK